MMPKTRVENLTIYHPSYTAKVTNGAQLPVFFCSVMTSSLLATDESTALLPACAKESNYFPAKPAAKHYYSRILLPRIYDYSNLLILGKTHIARALIALLAAGYTGWKVYLCYWLFTWGGPKSYVPNSCTRRTPYRVLRSCFVTPES